MRYSYYYNIGKMIYYSLAFVVNIGKSVCDKLHKRYSHFMRRKHKWQ